MLAYKILFIETCTSHTAHKNLVTHKPKNEIVYVIGDEDDQVSLPKTLNTVFTMQLI